MKLQSKLENGLIVIPVPKYAEDFIKSKQIEDIDLFVKMGFEILGTIDKNECSFDCTIYVDDFIDSPQYIDYFHAFKKMIENETDYLFENNKQNPINYRGIMDDDYYKIVNIWGQNQERLIEKLLIVKTEQKAEASQKV